MATTTGAETKPQGDTQEAATLFDAMHGALVSEAISVARDFGVDVVTVAFSPDEDQGAVMHEFSGAGPPEARVRRLLARDVSAMGPAELGRHAARLHALRAAVVRKRQDGANKKAAAADREDQEGTVVSSSSDRVVSRL